MSSFRLELVFPEAAAVDAWANATPGLDCVASLPHDVIPNDAERCPPPSQVFGLDPSGAESTVSIQREGLDPWHAIWAVVAARAHGGRGRAMATDVPYQWENEQLHLLISVAADGIDTQTVSGRQAKAYLDSPDLPPLKQMKARLAKR